jgi:predicted GNAT family acetyltransferase
VCDDKLKVLRNFLFHNYGTSVNEFPAASTYTRQESRKQGTDKKLIEKIME